MFCHFLSINILHYIVPHSLIITSHILNLTTSCFGGSSTLPFLFPLPTTIYCKCSYAYIFLLFTKWKIPISYELGTRNNCIGISTLHKLFPSLIKEIEKEEFRRDGCQLADSFILKGIGGQ